MRTKLGIHFDDDSVEERKQQKYKFAINQDERMSEAAKRSTNSDLSRTTTDKGSINQTIDDEDANEFFDSDEEDSDDGSVLSEISDENIYF